MALLQLGAPLFDEQGDIHPEVRFADLAAFIWMRETGTALPTQAASGPLPLLGVHEGTAYYLLFNGILGDRRPASGNVLTTAVLALPGEFERGTAFLSAMERNQILSRPDDYYVTSARRLGALTTADLNRAVQLFDTDKLLWIVVGDRDKVEPQLKALGLPMEVRAAP